jgi:uncharacterized protein YndB with AHSA1/START domain
MSDITVDLSRTLAATPEQVYAAVSDYAGVRSRILPPEITDYAVEAGGAGPGTVFSYRLHATKKRIRSVHADVSQPAERSLLESDRNSTLTVRWTVAPAGTGSEVTVTVRWQGAGGVGGFFERRFAPLGIRRIYTAELERLAAETTA